MRVEGEEGEACVWRAKERHACGGLRRGMRVEGQTSRTHHYALYACRALHTDAYDMGVEPQMHMICGASDAYDMRVEPCTSRNVKASACTSRT